MINDIASWIFNLLVWGAIVTFAVLLYEAFVSPGFLVNSINPLNALIAMGAIAVVSLLWPKY